MTPKNVVSWMSERSCFRKFYSSQSVHRSQTLLKSAWQDVYHYFPLIQDKLGQKTCLFVRCEILNLFCNTLTADDMYSRHSWGKFLLQVKTPLSQKGKRFFSIFIAFLQSAQNCGHLEKNFELYSLNSWEAIDFKKCGFLNARKLLFQNTLPQSKYSRVLSTAQICLAPPWPKFSINPTQIELENISVSQIWYRMTVW